MKNKLLVSIVALGLVACGKPMGGPDGGTGGGATGGGTGGSATGGGTGGGSATGGGTGGGSATGGGAGGGSGGGSMALGSSCAMPLTATLGAQAPMGILNMPGKKIHWRVAVTAGQFLVMDTNVNPTDMLSIDPTISVYNEAGTTLLATVDDAYPRASTDSTVFYRVATTGNLCVVVMDYATWKGEAGSTAQTMDVALTIGTLNDAAMVNNKDTEPNDTLAAPQTAKFFTNTAGTFSQANVYGMLDTATDADVYKFTLPATTKMFSVDFAPLGGTPMLGTNTYGSTLSHVAVKVTTTTGTVLGGLSIPAAIIDLPTSIGVAVTGGTDVLLWVERPAGVTPGTNDFYVVIASMSVDNPPEAMDSTNGVQATAEALTMAADPDDATIKQGFILGALAPAATDIDIFSFPAVAGDKVRLACGGERNGSGLRGTVYTISDATTVLTTEVESNAADIYWGPGTFASKPEISIATTGTYFFKVNGGTQDATNTGNYYRCGLYVDTP